MVHRRGTSRAGRATTLDDLAVTSSPDHVEAARATSDAFRKAGIRHVLVGGMAVGMSGYPRFTRDVDFLVGDEAFEFHGPIVMPKPGLPVRYAGVTIDWVSLDGRERSVFEKFLVVPAEGEVPVMPVVPLVAMKLLAGRQKDQADIVELLKSGVDYLEVKMFLSDHFPNKRVLFAHLLRLSKTED